MSTTQVIKIENREYVRKTISKTQNREYGLVRWQSQVRKMQLLRKYLPGQSLKIERMGCDNDNYFYDIAYLGETKNCIEAINNGLSPQILAVKIVHVVKKLAGITLDRHPGSFNVYIEEEIKNPLLLGLKILSEQGNQLSEAEAEVMKGKLLYGLDKIQNLSEKLTKKIIPECLTHGNLTLENMLWDEDRGDVILIDPYAETYCESILGDISQLFQSTSSAYEYVSSLNEEAEIRVDEYPYSSIPPIYTELSKEITTLLKHEEWYDDDIVALFRASQFTRMFPFKIVNNPRLGFVFLSHAMDLLGKIKC